MTRPFSLSRSITSYALLFFLLALLFTSCDGGGSTVSERGPSMALVAFAFSFNGGTASASVRTGDVVAVFSTVSDSAQV